VSSKSVIIAGLDAFTERNEAVRQDGVVRLPFELEGLCEVCKKLCTGLAPAGILVCRECTQRCMPTGFQIESKGGATRKRLEPARAPGANPVAVPSSS
jgi:hypothetical protein